MIPIGKLGEKCDNCGTWVRCPCCGNLLMERNTFHNYNLDKIFCSEKCEKQYIEKRSVKK
jgi:hypothetical protein